MPSARGGYRVKPANANKTAQVDTHAKVPTSNEPSMSSKPKRSNLDWKSPISKPTFRSKKQSDSVLVDAVTYQTPIPHDHPMIREPQDHLSQYRTTIQEENAYSFAEPARLGSSSTAYAAETVRSAPVAVTLELVSDTIDRLPAFPANTLDVEEARPAEVSSSDHHVIDEAEVSPPTTDTPERSDLFASDSVSIYSDSSSVLSSALSVYSSASSIYSSGASMYSLEEEQENGFDATASIRPDNHPRLRPVPIRRQETMDASPRERSTLAKKAALFKNSRLRPQLPIFSTSLPTWSLICRAAQASEDCYESRASTRRGTYIPAKTSTDIKAMIIDEQLIDETRHVIIAIRGTEFQSVSDWAVNKAADPVQHDGLFDDNENTCHAGFLQVTKAMVAQVTTQLSQHPASMERPALLFTGHSAGGAIASMLYSHMLSSSAASNLPSLADKFSSISCITFGAPPLSLRPLPRRDHVPGIFFSFANEGDPVIRLSNAAYVKSLAKLMTTSPPILTANAVAPVPKVVRGSRGTRVIRQTLPTTPLIPWEDLPLWPTPPAPLSNAGDVILLRDQESGSAAASRVTCGDLADVIFADLAQHGMQVYMRRVKDVAFAAMLGRNVY